MPTLFRFADQLADYLRARDHRLFKNYFDRDREQFVRQLIDILRSDDEWGLRKTHSLTLIQSVLSDPNKFSGKSLRPLLQSIYTEINELPPPRVLHTTRVHLSQSELFSLLHAKIKANTPYFTDIITSIHRQDHSQLIKELLEQSPITVNFNAFHVLKQLLHSTSEAMLSDFRVQNKFERILDEKENPEEHDRMHHMRVKQSLMGGRNVLEETLFKVKHSKDTKDTKDTSKRITDFFNLTINDHSDYPNPSFHPSARPVYGAMNFCDLPHGAAPAYGHSYLVLKPNIAMMCTFTPGDSFETQGKNPAPLANIHHLDPIIAHASDMLYRTLVEAAKQKAGLDYDEALINEIHATARLNNVPIGYVEAQIHTPITIMRDIQAINISLVEIKNEEQFDEWKFFFIQIEQQGVECNFIDSSGIKHHYQSFSSLEHGSAPPPTNHKI